MAIRLGQKLVNYVRFDKRVPYVQAYIFNMSDEEFVTVTEMEVDYEIPNDIEGARIIADQVNMVLKILDDEKKGAGK